MALIAWLGWAIEARYTHSILESLIHASTESWNTRPEIRERQVPVLEWQHRGLAVQWQVGNLRDGSMEGWDGVTACAEAHNNRSGEMEPHISHLSRWLQEKFCQLFISVPSEMCHLGRQRVSFYSVYEFHKLSAIKVYFLTMEFKASRKYE